MPYRVYGVYGNFEVRFSFLIRQWVDHFNAHKTAHPLATDMDIVGGLYIVKALVLRQFRAETICRHGAGDKELEVPRDATFQKFLHQRPIVNRPTS